MRRVEASGVPAVATRRGVPASASFRSRTHRPGSAAPWPDWRTDRRRAVYGDDPWLACGAARATDGPGGDGEGEQTRRSPFACRPRPLDGLKEDRGL